MPFMAGGGSVEKTDYRNVAGKPTAPVWDRITDAEDWRTRGEGVRAGGFQGGVREVFGVRAAFEVRHSSAVGFHKIGNVTLIGPTPATRTGNGVTKGRVGIWELRSFYRRQQR